MKVYYYFGSLQPAGRDNHKNCRTQTLSVIRKAKLSNHSKMSCSRWNGEITLILKMLYSRVIRNNHISSCNFCRSRYGKIEVVQRYGRGFKTRYTRIAISQVFKLTQFNHVQTDFSTPSTQQQVISQTQFTTPVTPANQQCRLDTLFTRSHYYIAYRTKSNVPFRIRWVPILHHSRVKVVGPSTSLPIDMQSVLHCQGGDWCCKGCEHGTTEWSCVSSH